MIPARLPARVIHIVESLDRGAVENWLLRMLRHARRRGIDVRWTFYCQLPRDGAMDAAARALGAKVIHSPVPLGRTAQFIKALRAEVRSGGYDVMHAHHDLVSALYLVAAARLPITRRIVHVHNADEALPTSNRLKQRILRPVLRRLCLWLSDQITGISNHTLHTFLQGRSPRPNRDTVHYYGVDPTPFQTVVADRTAFRRVLALPPDARILLFLGRMVQEKNPRFAVDVLAALRHLDPSAVGVFVGSGPERQGVEERARQLQLEKHVRLLGWRDDVAEVMASCDWFIHPRLEHPTMDVPVEGLGLALVEAQLAGLRLLVSRAVPPDALLQGASVARRRLADGPAAWAHSAVELLAQSAPSRSDAIATLGRSHFDLDFALADLMRLHEGIPAS
jgi:glycosyltransferase involved in cell wall biosynthesis